MQEKPAEDSVVIERPHLRGKGQFTLSAQVRRALHLKEGDEVDFIAHRDGQRP